MKRLTMPYLIARIAFTRLVFFLFACSLAASLMLPLRAVQAQGGEAVPRFRFERLTTSDGLAAAFSLQALLQDRNGFIWIGTGSGLDRYDGYTFEHIFPGDQIMALAEDHQGMIWFDAGLDLGRYDPATGTFKVFPFDRDNPTSLSSGVAKLYVDHAGTLWVGTWCRDQGTRGCGGLNRFDHATETFTRYQHDPDDPTSLSNGEVRAIYEDREGVLWVGTAGPRDSEPSPGSGGLNRFDRTTGTFTRYQHNPDDVYSLNDNRVFHINEDRQGRLYVGTCQVLHRYDRTHDRLERLLGEGSTQPYAPQGEGANCNEVKVIHEDAAGGFWVGAQSAGLNYFDRDKGTMTHFEHDPSDPYSLNHNNPRAMIEDRQGTLWIATATGLNKVVPNPARWIRPLAPETTASQDQRPYVATSLLVDTQGRLWVGTGGGELHRVDVSTDALNQTHDGHQIEFLRLLKNRVGGLHEDRQGFLWAGGHAGVHRIDSVSGSVLKHYVRDVDDPSSLRHDRVFDILEDKAGEIWIATLRGIDRLDRSTDTFIHYRHDDDDPRSVVSNNAMTIYEDRTGTLWFGFYGDGGVSRYDRAEDRFTTFVEDRSVNALYEDRQGRFWVGTYGTGLLLLDRTTGAITPFTTKDGLAHDIVGSIEEDEEGYLWIVTAGGLSRFDPERRHFVNFTEADGFPNTTTDPEEDEIAKSQAGMLFVGGDKGVTVVMPDNIPTNPHAPQVVVTGLLVFDAPLQEGGLVPASIALTHKQNDLTFQYVGLHLAQPEKNRYAYRLEGYDPEWRQVGTERIARYTNLDPGNYTFRVKAANGDGVWNEEGASVRITIHPPWWQTTWAYLLYGLLFLGSVFAADRFQRRRLITQERQRAEVEQERLRAEAAERELKQAREIEKAYHELRQTKDRLVQQEKMASLGALTAGIAHEIKNPLNFVTNFSGLSEELVDELREALQAGDTDEVEAILADLRLNASKIREHGQRADGIVRSMMQHARGGEGQREPTDLNALVGEYVDLAYHGKRAQTPDFTVEIERDLGAKVGEVEIVPQEIGRVILNLVGNAFDAVQPVASQRAATAPDGYAPTVKITTRRTGDAVEIRVADNGPGIPDNVREKIFEPFFTTKPTGSGTGLGLSLSYDIVTQGHGGRLTVESEDGQGATFIVTLPASKTEPDSIT